MRDLETGCLWCKGAAVILSLSLHWSGTAGTWCGLSETSMQKCLAETEMFALGGRILLCFQTDSFNLGFSSLFLLWGVAWCQAAALLASLLLRSLVGPAGSPINGPFQPEMLYFQAEGAASWILVAILCHCGAGLRQLWEAVTLLSSHITQVHIVKSILWLHWALIYTFGEIDF